MGLATKSRAHSHKNMILQRGNLAGLEGACGGKFLYGSFFLFFFFLQFFFISLCCKFFFVTVGFLFFFYKTLALKDSNTIQTMATNPHPWGPSQAGGSGAPAWLFLWLFSWRLAPVGRCGLRGAGGICTAVPWGDDHKKGYLNKITKSGAPTKTADDAHEGTWDTVEKRQIGPGRPWLSLEALWGEGQVGLAFRLQ